MNNFVAGDKVTVSFAENRKKDGTVVGRIWPFIWLVDFGKTYDDQYQYPVVLCLDTNVRPRKKKKKK